jgi:hypothetical protein
MLAVELCSPCSERFVAHETAASSVGEELGLALISALLCGPCFETVVMEGGPEPSVDSDPPGVTVMLYGYL